MDSLATKIQKKNTLPTLFSRFGILFIFIVACVLLSIITPKFYGINNILNIFKQVSLNGIIAVGMTFVIIAGDIDLSVGSISALAGVIVAGLEVNRGVNVWAGILISLIICTAIGVLMGVIITKTGVHAFVVTMGFMSIVRGICYLYTGGFPISGLSDTFRQIGGGAVQRIPNLVFFLAAVIFIGAIVLLKTPFGRNVFAAGGNREATHLAGINVDLVRIANFAICSFCAALSGILLASRVSSGQPIASEGAELTAIAAVVIGGTSMSGGKGTMFGTLVGALFLGVIQNGLNLLRVSPFYQQVFTGALIIIAVVLDSFKKEN